MYSYIKGTITEIESNFVTLENNDIGYMIYVSNPYQFKINNEYKIYIYQNIKEDENTLYGFNDIEQKHLFLKLIDVNGVGPKMALPIIATDPKEVIGAIEEGNINYLKKFPKIGDKVARQIILDLKGKLVNDNEEKIKNDELVDTLKALGYKTQDIKKILPNVKETEIEKQIKEALKLLMK